MAPAMLPEWAPHKAVWSAWPSRVDLWLDDVSAAREQVAAFLRAVDDEGRGEAVHVLAHGEEAEQSAAAAFAGTGVTIHPCPFGDIWLRDTAPIFLGPDRAVAFRFNGWGGKYVLDHDDQVARAVAKIANATLQHFDLILEGGAIEVDGAGRLITTEQCLLNPNRNTGLGRQTLEAMLQEAFGVSHVIWLGDGLAGDHTDGHVDNLARFVAPGHALVPSPCGDDDPNGEIYDDAASRLIAACCQVDRIPSPGRITGDDGTAIPASFMNFYIGNQVVVVPTYGTAFDDQAVAAIAQHFPDRQCIGLPADAILTGGGAFHCITQQVPLTSGDKP